MTQRFRYGHIPELHTVACRTQHEAAAAHISPSDKVGGEHQVIPKNSQQRFHVLRRRYASQEHDFAIGPYLLSEVQCVSLERTAVSCVPRANRNFRDLA